MGTHEKGRAQRRRRRTSWAAVATLAVLAFTSCGGEAEPDQPTITDAADLVRGAALVYDSSAGNPEPERVVATLGQMLFLAVVSDVPGTVRLDGTGVSQPVAADQPVTVVFNTEEVGAFDVTLNGDGVDVVLAQVEVRK